MAISYLRFVAQKSRKTRSTIWRSRMPEAFSAEFNASLSRFLVVAMSMPLEAPKLETIEGKVWAVMQMEEIGDGSTKWPASSSLGARCALRPGRAEMSASRKRDGLLWVVLRRSRP